MQTGIKRDGNTRQGIAPDTGDMDGWVKIAGNPSMKTWALHTSSDGSTLASVRTDNHYAGRRQAGNSKGWRCIRR
jgi:hypothetical protein